MTQPLLPDPEPEEAESEAPLAARMRPRSLAEFVGQDRILGPGTVLRRSIENDKLSSVILWGPPGTGKTTLARVIATTTKSRFVPLSAVSAGVADLRKAVDAAQKLRAFNGQRTVLFIDEIHRFNKAQQDAVLPHVEDGIVTLIGATTENPGFEVNAALLSRCRVFRLDALSQADLEALVGRALADTERGLGGRSLIVENDAIDRLVRMSGGDARVALTALEFAADSVEAEPSGDKLVTTEIIEDALQRPALLYDRAGDMHYHLISAFIKSVRGSDPDASVYWLARMLEAGEDPMFVARRLVILAAEDVGLAQPQALVVATACQQAVHLIGMPEGYLPLTECTLFLALAPKSNSAITSYYRARADVENTLNEPVPLHLRNAVTGLQRAEGYGDEYRYSHDFEEHFVAQQYLPDRLVGHRYYEAGTEGDEGGMNSRLDRLKKQSTDV